MENLPEFNRMEKLQDFSNLPTDYTKIVNEAVETLKKNISSIVNDRINQITTYLSFEKTIQKNLKDKKFKELEKICNNEITSLKKMELKLMKSDATNVKNCVNKIRSQIDHFRLSRDKNNQAISNKMLDNINTLNTKLTQAATPIFKASRSLISPQKISDNILSRITKQRDHLEKMTKKFSDKSLTVEIGMKTAQQISQLAQQIEALNFARKTFLEGNQEEGVKGFEELQKVKTEKEDPSFVYINNKMDQLVNETNNKFLKLEKKYIDRLPDEKAKESFDTEIRNLLAHAHGQLNQLLQQKEACKQLKEEYQGNVNEHKNFITGYRTAILDEFKNQDDKIQLNSEQKKYTRGKVNNEFKSNDNKLNDEISHVEDTYKLPENVGEMSQKELSKWIKNSMNKMHARRYRVAEKMAKNNIFTPEGTKLLQEHRERVILALKKSGLL